MPRWVAPGIALPGEIGIPHLREQVSTEFERHTPGLALGYHDLAALSLVFRGARRGLPCWRRRIRRLGGETHRRYGRGRLRAKGNRLLTGRRGLVLLVSRHPPRQGLILFSQPGVLLGQFRILLNQFGVLLFHAPQQAIDMLA